MSRPETTMPIFHRASHMSWKKAKCLFAAMFALSMTACSDDSKKQEPIDLGADGSVRLQLPVALENASPDVRENMSTEITISIDGSEMYSDTFAPEVDPVVKAERFTSDTENTLNMRWFYPNSEETINGGNAIALGEVDYTIIKDAMSGELTLSSDFPVPDLSVENIDGDDLTNLQELNSQYRGVSVGDLSPVEVDLPADAGADGDVYFVLHDLDFSANDPEDYLAQALSVGWGINGPLDFSITDGASPATGSCEDQGAFACLEWRAVHNNQEIYLQVHGLHTVEDVNVEVAFGGVDATPQVLSGFAESEDFSDPFDENDSETRYRYLNSEERLDVRLRLDRALMATESRAPEFQIKFTQDSSGNTIESEWNGQLALFGGGNEEGDGDQSGSPSVGEILNRNDDSISGLSFNECTPLDLHVDISGLRDSDQYDITWTVVDDNNEAPSGYPPAASYDRDSDNVLVRSEIEGPGFLVSEDTVFDITVEFTTDTGSQPLGPSTASITILDVSSLDDDGECS